MPTVERNFEASLVLMMSMNRFITTSASHWPGGHHGDGDLWWWRYVWPWWWSWHKWQWTTNYNYDHVLLLELTVIDVKAELMVGKNIFILVHVFHRDHCNWKWFSLQLNGKIIFSWNGKIIWSAQTYIDNIYISATSLDLEYPRNSGFCHKNIPEKHSSLPFCTYWPFNGRLESV